MGRFSPLGRRGVLLANACANSDEEDDPKKEKIRMPVLIKYEYT